MDRDDIRDPDRDDSPPSAEEIAAAVALRDALGTSAPHAGADFARAVALSHGAPGRGLSVAEHAAIVDRAIAQREARRVAVRRRSRRVVIGVAGALALAATIPFLIGRASPQLEESAVEPLVPMHSTQPLFREPFPRGGGGSARIDRIASARGSDLRDNRFTAWGVR